MKRSLSFLAAALLMVPAVLRAQDAAVEERLNKLSAQIEDLIVAKDAQNKRLDELARAVRDLQDQQNRPNASYASQDDVKHLAAKLQEVDKKRQEDIEGVAKDIDKLAKLLRTTPAVRPPPPEVGDNTPPAKPEKGYEYDIKADDTLSAIAKAYSDRGFKVTVDQILKANPGLKPERMKVGQKIFIPAGTP